MARQRRATTKAREQSVSGISDTSDYERRLDVASQARARVEANRAKRSEKRKEIEAWYKDSVSDIRNRIQKAHAKYRSRLAALHEARVVRLAKAMKARDSKRNEIVSKLKDIQQHVDNFGVQLLTVYSGFHEDASQLVAGQGKQRADKKRGA